MREDIVSIAKIALGNIDSQELYLSPEVCKILSVVS